MFLLVFGIKAEAAELKVLSAIGMQSVMEDLGPKFEHAHGHKLVIAFATGGATVKRARDVNPLMLSLLPNQDRWLGEGWQSCSGRSHSACEYRNQRGHSQGRCQVRRSVIVASVWPNFSSSGRAEARRST